MDFKQIVPEKRTIVFLAFVITWFMIGIIVYFDRVHVEINVGVVKHDVGRESYKSKYIIFLIAIQLSSVKKCYSKDYS